MIPLDILEADRVIKTANLKMLVHFLMIGDQDSAVHLAIGLSDN